MTSASEGLGWFVDTSVVARYLTGEPADLAERASRIFDGDETLYLTDVVIIESAYVLTSVYEIPRAAVVDALMELVQKRNIRIFGFDKGTMLAALLLCRPSGRVSFADAMIWAAASTVPSGVYTFDSRFPSAGIQVLREPG
jgi:predicted nucleic acid-binding protein